MEQSCLSTFQNTGACILDPIYSEAEIQAITACISNANHASDAYMKRNGLFAIRQLLKYIPELKPLIFTTKLHSLLNSVYPTPCFLTKAIYFDKPATSNWFVAYHQDLSISVDRKASVTGYQNWTSKKGQYGVQPPVGILEKTLTVRIHLDDTDAKNGALKIIPGSHLRGIIRVENVQTTLKNEQICTVKKGGIMLMSPLLLHASNRSSDNRQRRVIHLEFHCESLPMPLNWLEYQSITDEYSS